MKRWQCRLFKRAVGKGIFTPEVFNITWGLSLDYGIRHARMAIEWCDQALKDLEAGKKKKVRLKAKNP